MTKGQLDGIRDYYATMRSTDITRVVSDITGLIEALEQAWQERDEAIMEGLRLTKLLEKAEQVKDEKILNLEATKIEMRKWVERARMLEQSANDRMSELHDWRSNGITEDLLRKGDGYLKVGRGCVLVTEQHLAERVAEIVALKAHKIEVQAQFNNAMSLVVDWREKAGRLQEVIEQNKEIAECEQGAFMESLRASEAVAVALQKSNALLHRAAPLIYRRHTMVSGSLEMAECDAACRAAGLDVWRWPKPEARDASPLEPIDVLRAIEGNLVEASNLLQDERLEENERFELLDMEINVALREVQAWKEEVEG